MTQESWVHKNLEERSVGAVVADMGLMAFLFTALPSFGLLAIGWLVGLIFGMN